MSDAKIEISENSFCISSGDGGFTENQMDMIQEIMDESARYMMNEAKKLAENSGIPENEAMTILYLRTRSRWTEELERQAIGEIKRGFSISMHYPPRRVCENVFVDAEEAFNGDVPPEYSKENT